MRIAIASGKGGAGKTMLTASLHSIWPVRHILADCDVEAPNLQFFVQPKRQKSIPVTLEIPEKVTEACNHCGKCREICRYGAIAQFGKKITLFSDMCHGCGGCFAVCAAHALEKGQRTLGQLEIASLGKNAYIAGSTRIGEVMTPPVLRKLFAELAQMLAQDERDVLIDCPPGVSCPAVTVARNVDAMVLVADPTPFGYADFCLAFEAFRSLDLPLACVLNRSEMPGNAGGDSKLLNFCADQGIPVAGQIPFSREAALTLAQGGLLPELSLAWRTRFETIGASLLQIFGEVPHA
ncbi:MAG: (4Fe-4S)-binding protein [Desulfovibrio sp.]|nr:(4Fe-4S)-binding protein [Desulfovibrio sp.]